jgi:hypothetical protein
MLEQEEGDEANVDAYCCLYLWTRVKEYRDQGLI